MSEENNQVVPQVIPEEKKQIMGLKRMRTGGSRRSEWNRPNKKALERLEGRIKAFEKTGDKGGAYHRPGSMKVY